MSSIKFVFFGPIRKTRWLPWPLIFWDIFPLLWTRWTEFNKFLQEARFQRHLPSLCFWTNRKKNKIDTSASDWLKHFWLLLRNHWTEFKLTWQVAWSQRPLPILCFSGRSKKARWPPGLWLAKPFSTFPLKPLNGIQWNLTESKILTSSTKIIFLSGRSVKTKMAVLADPSKRWHMVTRSTISWPSGLLLDL